MRHEPGFLYIISNHPPEFVVVAWLNGKRVGIKARCDSLEQARNCIPNNLFCVRASENDDGVVELWGELTS